MKKVSDFQINTRVYWNDSYTNPIKAHEYKADSKRFTEAVKYIKEGDKFIDLGCGVAKVARLLTDKVECWGVDISDDVIEQNKKELKGNYQQGYIGSLEFLPQNYFDVVFCGETIEHLDDPSVLFKEAFGILKTGGKLIVTTPFENRVGSTEHIWSFDKEDVEKMFKDNGFKNISFVDLSDLEYLLIIFGIGEK